MNTRAWIIFATILYCASSASSSLAIYHPRMGRFLQRDAGHMKSLSAQSTSSSQLSQELQFIPSDQYLDGMNLYQYLRSQPVFLLDPSGQVVYWGARDLAALPWGNHHSIFIIPDTPADFPTNQINLGCNTMGFTLGWFEVGGRLRTILNQQSDVMAAREFFDPDNNESIWKADFDLELHPITPPGGMGDSDFIRVILAYQGNYDSNEQYKNIKYVITGPNCETGVNSMFSAVGIMYDDRVSLGQFFGIDWGHERLLNLDYFRLSPPAFLVKYRTSNP